MSLRIDVDVSEVERLAKKTPAAEQALFRSMMNPMRLSLERLQQDVQALTPVNIGNLRGGIKTFINGRPPSFSGDVLPTALYGDAVEWGRPAGKFPPIDAIEFWVRRKLGITENARGVAFVIARAIARGQSKHQREGGSRMFERGLSRGFPAVERIWDAWTKEAANIAVKVLNQK